ncbi:MAG: transposase [Clostridia bacterium]|nr:transposase [Clostridia bacterium]
MPRQGRVLSKTGVYHLMVRGNEKRDIFLNDEDRLRFIDTLDEKKKDHEYFLYGYCLMDNHVHLLIREGKDPISRVMKRINTSFAYYFNKKYNRVGHVFQDRYISEAIDSDSYLLTALRYIHNNPVKAGVVKEPSSYRWSSFNSYIGKDKVILIERDEILGMYSENKDIATQRFSEFTRENNDDYLIDLEDENPRKDKRAEVKRFVEEYLLKKERDFASIKTDKKLREELVRALKITTDASVRLIAEILELNRNMVQRIK